MNTPQKLNTSQKLIMLRKQRKWTQKEVAKRIGVSVSTIAMLEIGARRGSDRLKKQLARLYEVPVDYLFFQDDEDI
jgi:transcriptional regulator with XRE-family HTH domain